VTETAAPFTLLAGVYDAIMADVEYEEWAEFVLLVLREEGWAFSDAPPASVKVLDLACGTGNSARPYVERGYRVTGVDASDSMLEVARRKLPLVAFHRAGFLDLELGERFHLVTCVFDSLNNLTDPEDLERAFARVFAHLEPGGYLAFDVNTALGVRELWDDDAFEGRVDSPLGPVHFRWSHAYDAERDLGLVTAYCATPRGEFVERHAERGYGPQDLAPMLERAGFEDVVFLEYPDMAVPDETSPRVWGFARRGPMRGAAGGDSGKLLKKA
jgi:SAM-dependent methyltransferase